MKTGKILPRQLAVTLTVGALPPLLLMRAPRASLMALPAVLLGGAVLLLPAAAWARHPSAQSPAQWAASYLHRWVGKALAVLYGVFLLLAGVETTARTGLLLRETELPNPLAPGLLILLCAAAAYGAWMGIESTARMCGLLAAGGVILLIVLGATLRTVWTPELLQTAAVDDASAISAGLRLTGTLGVPVAALMVLCPWSGGIRARRTAGWWAVLVGLAAILAVLSVGVLGDWAELRSMPLYAAALVAPHGTLLRPAGAFGALLVLSAYARMAVLLVGVSVCMQAFDVQPVRAAALPVGAAVCAAAGIALLHHAPAIDALTALQDGCVPVLTIGIPLLLGVIRWQKERKQ